MVEIRRDILYVTACDTDFRSALTELGTSISETQHVLGDWGSFCTQVFGPAPQTETEFPQIQEPVELSPIVSEPTSSPSPEPISKPEQSPETQPILLKEGPQSVPAVGTVLLKADYHGPALSARDTMDRLSLGALETMTPVIGRQTSEYGWRTHPISGKQHFHGGADISGKMGEKISAFSDGTVEYTGRDRSYGLYLQLDHGNGVKSFYAHCSKLCVKKGQHVKIGEKIAEIGSTGCSTGPHLHLELKCGDKRLNPAYYIQFTNG